MLRCSVFGHRYRFSAEGAVMRWECQRDCGAGGSKAYASPAAARRYAAAFDREDRDELGRRAPCWACSRCASGTSCAHAPSPASR